MFEHVPDYFLLGGGFVNISEELSRWIMVLYFTDENTRLVGFRQLESILTNFTKAKKYITNHTKETTKYLRNFN